MDKRPTNYWICSPSRFFSSRDVKFYEHIFPFHFLQPQSDIPLPHITTFIPDIPTSIAPVPPDGPTSATPAPSAVSPLTHVSPHSRAQTSTEVFPSQGSPSLTVVDTAASQQSQPVTSPTPSHTTTITASHTIEPQHVSLRRTSRQLHQSHYLKDYFCGVVSSHSLPTHLHALVSVLSQYKEPRTYEEAAADPAWVAAMNKEIEALMLNNTWDLVPLPTGKKAISSKWVYRVKLKSDGSLERFKARLVIRGFTQKYGVDY